MVPLGLRMDKRSDAAMKPASTQATVVKNPKTPWMRVKELCMMGGRKLRCRRGGCESWTELGLS